ncbi:sensor histidine kinase KdpD [Kribbella sp. VKM Ac-2571]|uniref:sensor histidine kinase n=1 Tax=Kribbella sp. VKM Ac-2571 TaxID=2512222 RepID=UPI001414FD21|nr:HAMP domain-containing sensor histidine kinase [Kribbella sp. VKM Ac-2571]
MPDLAGLRAAYFRPAQRIGLLIDISVAAVVVGMLGLMIVLPSLEAGPFHLMFLAVAIAYGYRTWPLVPILSATVAFTLLGGWLMAEQAAAGRLPKAELAEIALMPMVLLVMIWHVRRRVAAVEELEQMAGRQLEAVQREHEFVRDASHAIRTPVTIARGHLELVAAGELDEEVRSDLYVAMLQLERLTALSDRLLAVAQLDSGGALSEKPTDLGSLIRELAANWSAQPDRTWRFDCEPTGWVLADPEWIEQALDALIENALNFTSAGGEISLRCWRADGHCIVEVADSGPGIEPEDLPYVFDRFWHRMPPNGRMGTGLGLAMARSAAIAHGGELTAKNGPNGGAVFELRLPGG